MSTPQIVTATYKDIPALTEMFINAYANNEAMQAALRSDEVADYAHGRIRGFLGMVLGACPAACHPFAKRTRHMVWDLH